MKQRPSPGPSGMPEMRRRAEARLADETPGPGPPPSEWPRIQHELTVHQIELEMQNEQLRLTHAALEASRDRYRDLYENAPVGYVTLGMTGAIVDANRAATAVMGAPRHRLIGRAFADQLAFDQHTLFRQRLSALVSGDGPQTVELRLYGRAAPARWVALQMMRVVNADEGLLCRAAVIDITHRVHMQEGVARLAAIVESSEDAIVARDAQGLVTAWNDAAARLFGRPAQAMLGQTLDALVPRDRHAEEADLLRRLAAGQKVSHLETERLDAEGRTLTLAISLSPMRDDKGHVVGSAMIARDVGERRRADLALRHRLRQLDVLSQAGQALILGEADAPLRRELFKRVAAVVGSDLQLHFALDADNGNLMLMSSTGLTDLEQQQAMSIETTDTLWNLIAETGKPLVINELQASTLSQAAWWRDAGARCFAGFPLAVQGRLYGVAAFATRERDEFHEGDLQVMRTVCDQVAAMIERARLLDELHANERALKRADRAKDDFIATLAHELRNPLAPIRNAVGIMRHGERVTPQQVAWCRDIIERQVVQMTRLLEDLLDVSRVTRNKIELRRERIDLMRAVEQAVETTRPLIEAREQHLVIEPANEPIVLYGDLTRLTQVFANLLNNAAKYTDTGGQITLSVSASGSTARVGVRDTGIGIEAQHLTQVFDMFAQLAPALQRAGGGLGIGLALTRGLVELHDGHIEAYSAGLGHGSEFVITLPIVPSQLAQPGAAPATDTHAETPHRRMLVVDDNADAAQTLSALLALNGQEVRTVFTGEEAIDAIKDWPPDAAVLDIGLPDINGYDLCRHIRAQPWGQEPLLVACTGWGQREDIERARAAGFDFHIVKPIDPNAVLDLLTQGRRAPQALAGD